MLRRPMRIVSDWIRRSVLSLELRFSDRTSFFGKVRLLRVLHRNVTADVRMLGVKKNVALGFAVQFKTPYLHLPIAVVKGHIGHEDTNREFSPAAFRFFDWHTWAHIKGRIEWQGEHQLDVEGNKLTVVNGFSYWIHEVRTPLENFGLRLAEGVEGSAKVLLDREIIRVKFEPLYWMFEPKHDSYSIIAINESELAAFIVSLSEIGSGNPRVYDKAIARLEEWATFTLDQNSSEKALLQFLQYVRDWGALGMEPLFDGLKEVLERLHIEDKERILFEFYADNWGVRNNWHGRLLAVKLLGALGTRRALIALESIFDYVKNQAVPANELEVVKGTINRVENNMSLASRGKEH